MQKNLLDKKNNVNLYHVDKEENGSDQMSVLSMRSAPPPEDKEAKEMFEFMKNNKFKRTLSNRRLKKPLEFHPNLSQIELKEKKNKFGSLASGFLNLDSYKNNKRVRSRSHLRNSRAFSRKGRTYLQSISESDYNDSISALSRRSKTFNNDMPPKEFGKFLNVTKELLLKSRKSISKPKDKLSRKRLSFMPNSSGVNELRAFRASSKNNKNGGMKKRKTINIFPNVEKKSNVNKTPIKKKNSLNTNKNNQLETERVRKMSKSKTTKKLKESWLKDYLPRDDSVDKRHKEHTKRIPDKKFIDKTKYTADKTVVTKKYKKPSKKNGKKKADKSKVKASKPEKEVKPVMEVMQIKINGVAINEENLKKSMRSESILSSDSPLDEVENKDTNPKQSSSNNIPLLGIPKRKTIVSMKKMAHLTSLKNIPEQNLSKSETNISTPTFPIEIKFTGDPSNIKENGKEPIEDKSGKLIESLEMIEEDNENTKGHRISSNKVLLTLNSKRMPKKLEQSSFKNYFHLKSINNLPQEHRVSEFSELFNTTGKFSVLSGNRSHNNSSNYFRQNTNESVKSPINAKTGKRRTILLNSHTPKITNIDESEPYREKKQNLVNTSNDFISFVQFSKDAELNSTKFFK